MSAIGKGRRQKGAASDIASMKWEWLDQVLLDRELPAAAFKIAYLLAHGHMNNITGRCDPSQALLAKQAGLQERQVRSLIAQLSERGHLLIVRAGKRASNSYELILHERQENTGHREDMTGNFASGDRQNNAGMTGKKMPPNPISEPGIEPHAVGVGGVRSTTKGSSGRAKRARYRKDDQIEINRYGRCEVQRSGRNWIIVRSIHLGDTLRVDLDGDGNPVHSSARVLDDDLERDVK